MAGSSAAALASVGRSAIGLWSLWDHIDFRQFTGRGFSARAAGELCAPRGTQNPIFPRCQFPSSPAQNPSATRLKNLHLLPIHTPHVKLNVLYYKVADEVKFGVTAYILQGLHVLLNAFFRAPKIDRFFSRFLAIW